MTDDDVAPLSSATLDERTTLRQVGLGHLFISRFIYNYIPFR
jgi:hypothetical protein